MQAIDALRTVIGLAEEHNSLFSPANQDDADGLLREQQAIELVKQISQNALPIARFECMVTIERVGDKSKLGLGDFTVCALDIAGLRNGLVGLSMEKATVYIRLWERFQHSNEMLSGYQGETKTLNYRNFLADLDRFQAERQPHQAMQNVAS